MKVFVPANASGPGTVKMTVSTQPSVGMTVGADIIRPPATYSGPLIVTPTEDTQTLDTGGKVVGGNIVIEPIPNNYGLITWNGSVLTVS